MDHDVVRDADGRTYLETSLTDYALMGNPLLNKGTAFHETERKTFGLLGLLPPHQSTIDEQAERSLETLHRKNTDLEKYVYLRDLQDSNETLFYHLVVTNIEDLLPLVYTPTVGAGCQLYSHIYRRPRGVYIAYPHMANIDAILANRRFDKVRVIVVSDGERILGLGDQGAGGMGIPIGKLALYTACAGIHPVETLPILLDTGTNNPELMRDRLYIGWRHERVRGDEYNTFVDAFVRAVNKRFPDVLLQWEDIAQANAGPLLGRYRDTLCTFNDDIQGTASVATATLLAAVKVTGMALADQRVVIVGAGSAGCGIADLVLGAMVKAGSSEQEARRRVFLVDKDGLLLEDSPQVLPFQKRWAQPRDVLQGWDIKGDKVSLADVVEHARPTLLIGVSGQPGIFTESIVRTMARGVKRPIIFPLSNPTSRSEAHPADLLTWTDDRAIVGTGSPFGTVQRKGQPVHIDQTNNCYIFPGLGLGLVAVRATRVTDAMFMVAAEALAACAPRPAADGSVHLLPPLRQIRDVSFKVACAVAREAISKGLAPPMPLDQVDAVVAKRMWDPEYLPYRRRR